MSESKEKEKLLNSLMALLDDYKFDEISVAMICKHANLSRSTFYRRFQDKQELALHKVDEYYGPLLRRSTRLRYFKSRYTLVYDFMWTEKEYFTKIIKIKGQNSYEDQMFHQIVVHLTRTITEEYKEEVDTRMSYSIEMFANNVIYITVKWIENGFLEAPEELTDIVFENMPERLKKYIVT